MKHFQKNKRKCWDIKTKKVHEDDWDGTLTTKLKYPLPYDPT